eukprot:CAMPEP_0177682100 /NCGR_PEP_ID=MMETSP0447-20121125/31075_1 /TAXON_ID=0 /ORGANISM="Stygamoeba regulata, Strain BSH-02190019" /LENGTH=170 /DNA_ID=CAMNT_0019191573 /DNA_START=102 /DNA_END=614 /DNA_ORIENTATION=+
MAGGLRFMATHEQAAPEARHPAVPSKHVKRTHGHVRPAKKVKQHHHWEWQNIFCFAVVEPLRVAFAVFSQLVCDLVGHNPVVPREKCHVYAHHRKKCRELQLTIGALPHALCGRLEAPFHVHEQPPVRKDGDRQEEEEQAEEGADGEQDLIVDDLVAVLVVARCAVAQVW